MANSKLVKNSQFINNMKVFSGVLEDALLKIITGMTDDEKTFIRRLEQATESGILFEEFISMDIPTPQLTMIIDGLSSVKIIEETTHRGVLAIKKGKYFSLISDALNLKMHGNNTKRTGMFVFLCIKNEKEYLLTFNS